jgi:transposase
MANISTIGFDLAKNVFQIHGIDAAGRVLRRQLRRGQMEKFFASLPPTVVGMEACSGAHHWTHVLKAWS